MGSPFELWREVPETNGTYEVSNHGRVRKILKQSNWAGAYKTVCINRKMVLVHRLVCAAFGADPTGLVVNHKNGIKSDNRAENLEPVTHSGNQNHAILLGLVPLGENRGSTKISAETVAAIRTSGLPHLKIGAKYGISRSQVSRIRKGASWKYVPGGNNGAKFVPTEGYGKGFNPSESFTFEGKTQTVTEWAKELKINRGTLSQRLFEFGWDPAQAFTRPVTRITNRKLTDEQILAIARSNETHAKLASQFGVAQSQITRIKNGQRWGKLTGL